MYNDNGGYGGFGREDNKSLAFGISKFIIRVAFFSFRYHYILPFYVSETKIDTRDFIETFCLKVADIKAYSFY